MPTKCGVCVSPKNYRPNLGLFNRLTQRQCTEEAVRDFALSRRGNALIYDMLSLPVGDTL